MQSCLSIRSRSYARHARSDFSGREYEYATRTPVTDFFPPEKAGTFMGYLRENGDVGTRNYVAVIATSNCSSHVTMQIAEQLKRDILCQGFRHDAGADDGGDQQRGAQSFRSQPARQIEGAAVQRLRQRPREPPRQS